MNRYREARINAGLSQKAAAISLGIRPPSMSNWERGISHPDHDHLVAMAALYNVTTDYLTGASDTKEKQPTAKDGELLENVYQMLSTLPTASLLQVRGYLDGLKAQQGIGSAPSADPGADPEAAP